MRPSVQIMVGKCFDAVPDLPFCRSSSGAVKVDPIGQRGNLPAPAIKAGGRQCDARDVYNIIKMYIFCAVFLSFDT